MTLVLECYSGLEGVGASKKSVISARLWFIFIKLRLPVWILSSIICVLTTAIKLYLAFGKLA